MLVRYAGLVQAQLAENVLASEVRWRAARLTFVQPIASTSPDITYPIVRHSTYVALSQGKFVHYVFS